MYPSLKRRRGLSSSFPDEFLNTPNLPMVRYGGSNTFKKSGKKSSSPYGQLARSTKDRHVSSVNPPPEIKTFDMAADGNAPVSVPVQVSVPNTGGVVMLNSMASGAGSNARVGLSVVIKNCSYRFELDLGPTPVPTSGRVMLVWDKQPNGAAATYTQIFTTPNYLSFGLNQNFDRFVILRNQQFSLSPNGNQSLFFEGFAKVNMKTTYGPAAIPNSGALLAIFIADQAVAANAPLISGTWRVRYVDV